MTWAEYRRHEKAVVRNMRRAFLDKALAEAGSFGAMCDDLDVTSSNISPIMRDIGFDLDSIGATVQGRYNALRAEYVRMIERGLSVAQMAREMDVQKETVWANLRRFGLRAEDWRTTSVSLAKPDRPLTMAEAAAIESQRMKERLR